MTKLRRQLLLIACGTAIGAVVAARLESAAGSPYTSREKAAYANRDVVAFVRPGLTIRVLSAEIATDGTISATVSVTDPKGLPLDRNGTNTPVLFP